MKTKLVSILLITALTFMSLSCAVPEKDKGAVVGAGVGAVAGAVIGQVIGRDTKATVIGAMVGGLVGGIIGKYDSTQKKTRKETARVYQYEPSKQTILMLEEILLSPSEVKPGDLVMIKLTYAVLHPTPEAKIEITETREITYNGELVGKPEVKVERADGTYTSTVPLKLPAAAKKGRYVVRATVASENLKDAKEMAFIVN